MTEYRIANHYYRWTIIDTHIVDGVKYALMESSIGDEAPYILIKISALIVPKAFRTKSGDLVKLMWIPEENIIDDEVYDDIETALEDNDIL